MRFKPMIHGAVFGVLAALAPMPAGPGLYAQTSEAAPAAQLTAAQVREDLDLLYRNLAEGHYDLYVYRSRADYDAYYNGLREGISGPMDRADAAVLYQHLAAFGRIGHASTDAPAIEFIGHIGGGGTFVPLFARVEPDGRILLTRTGDKAGTAPAGSELIAVDGEPAARLLVRLADGVSAERAYMAHAKMEETLPALLWIARRSDAALPVTLLVDGVLRETVLPAVTYAELREIGAAHPAKSPDTDFDTREARMLEDGIAYLRPGPFGALEGEGDASPRAFMAFVDKAFEGFIADGARDLILDLRNNPGGDISFSDPMIAWFADKPFRFASSFMLRASAPTKAHYDALAKDGPVQDATLARLIAAEQAQPNGARYPFEIAMVAPRSGARFTGRVWVLVNRHSYSNATTSAALIQDYGFGTILGEETADVPTSFASIVHFTLPNSGYPVAYPKSHFVRPNGDEAIHGVIPDVALPRQPVSAPQDVMLERAIETIARARAD